MAGPGAVAFFFDLSSPDAYLAAERVLDLLGGAAEWTPVLAARLPADEVAGFQGADERNAYMRAIERRARARGLQPLRWPPGWPADVELAMRVATYAKQIGRVVAFSLAAFRQAFAAGRDLATPDGVVIAAAACELHPTAVLRSAERRAVRAALARATADAAAVGVRRVPAVRVGERVFHGDEQLEDAAALVAARAA
jgi:2-hydroxychromene-2-carboxylate isomerase